MATKEPSQNDLTKHSADNSPRDFKDLNPSEYAEKLAQIRRRDEGLIPGTILGVPDGWVGVSVGISPRADVTISKLSQRGYIPLPTARVVGDPSAKVLIIPAQTREEMTKERADRIKVRLA